MNTTKFDTNTSTACKLQTVYQADDQFDRLGSFRFECHSIFKYIFIPKCVILCGKHKNDNHFVEKPIIKCLICIFVSEIA